MSVVQKMLEHIPIPRFVEVEQAFSTPALRDVEQSLLDGLRDPGISSRIPKGGNIGITVGSRGIANLQKIVSVLVRFVREKGAHPYILPSMGSHGNADAKGQEEVLRGLGIEEATVGAPVLSGMEVVELGETEDGITVYYDKNAFQMDGVILFNRIKAHTDIDGDVESGLQKMIAVGLGDHTGAAEMHKYGMECASARIQSIGCYALAHANILFGVAVLENEYDQTGDVVCIPPEEIPNREKELLRKSKRQLPRFLMNDIDLLIVDRIGKDVSGDGMDPNVIGRSILGCKNPGIRIKRIVTLGLTGATGGSAHGVGLSDVTTRRIFDRMDLETMYANAITSIALKGSCIPPVMETDRLAIQLGIKAACVADPERLRAVRIRDTLHLGRILVAEAFAREVGKIPGCRIAGPAKDLPFRPDGSLLD